MIDRGYVQWTCIRGPQWFEDDFDDEADEVDNDEVDAEGEEARGDQLRRKRLLRGKRD